MTGDPNQIQDPELRTWHSRLTLLQDRIRSAIRQAQTEQSIQVLSRSARDEAGDTIFGLDISAEEAILPLCEEWAKDTSFVLVAEGIEPSTGKKFGRNPEWRLILDPVDGTRGLMYDKRSAWSLAGLAREGEGGARLQDIELAVMSELPTSRQNLADRLWAVRGQGAFGERYNLDTGEGKELPLVPSKETDLRHGFATVCNFFQGGKELISRLEEELMYRLLGGWRSDKAEVYCDQYICSGGQLAEIALGRDRLVIDIRPLVYRAHGEEGTLCSRPYDLCCMLVAQETGCRVSDPDGGELDSPLNTSTNLSFVAYANAELAEIVQPVLSELLRKHGLVS
ncbi:MAG: FIG domain-containing protein [Planctomycetota bacterium]|jgi:fructose-1,6-bisphosphatase/inositol monophosphatase family enzyme